MKKLVIRDRDGAVINIGPWEYITVDVLETFIDESGNPAQRKVGERIANPIPDGATSAEEDVITTEDGGLAAATDHVSLRRVAYPKIADQLDALWKGGDAATAMRERVLAIKSKYPKA